MNDRQLGVFCDRVMMADEPWEPGHERSPGRQEPFWGTRYPRLFIPFASLVLWGCILALAFMMI